MQRAGMMGPAFEPQDHVHPGPASSPLIDETLTTAPPRSSSAGSTAWVTRNAPVRLMRSVASHRSGDSSSSAPLSPTPALLTSTSARPKRAVAAAATARAPAGVAASAPTRRRDARAAPLAVRADLRGDRLERPGAAAGQDDRVAVARQRPGGGGAD